MMTMKPAVQIIRNSLENTWEDLWTVLAVNLLWTLSVLLIIPGPPAIHALFYYGNRLAHGEVADLSDYWRDFRHNWWTSWRWGIINLIVFVVLIGDYILTGELIQPPLTQYVQGFYISAAAGWLVLQFYTLPFLFEQETPSVRQALRNGAVLIGKNLLFSLGLIGLLVLLLSLGTILFMLTFAFGGVVVAVSANRAVQNRLDKLRSASARVKSANQLQE